jgi:tripartite-type tricarboxylate transporter receptor subunit TctC
VVVRPINEYLSKAFGQQFITENRPGANGNIGALQVAKSAPDGYSLLFGTTSQLTINPALYSMPFDSVADFAPIAITSQNPGAVVVSASASFPASTLKELIAYAKASPGKLTYSSAGNGSQNHLAGALLGMITKTDLVHVPYKGGGPALTAVLAGEVGFIVQSPALALPQVRAGKLKVLVVSSPKRLATVPDVPTNEELGLPEFKSRAGTGYLAPAKTPRPIIDRLNTEINRFLTSSEGQKLWSSQGIEVTVGSPEDFARIIQDELARWSGVVKAGNIKVD